MLTPEEKRERRRETVRKNNAKRSAERRAWNQLRNFGHVIEKTHCEACETRDGGPKGFVVHHKDGQNGKNGLPLNNDRANLIVLCRPCHVRVHSRWGLREVESLGR